MAQSAKKILITGCCGMLGAAIWNELEPKYSLDGVDIVAGKNNLVADIADKSQIEKVIQDLKPDIIIHTAAYTDVDGCQLNPKRADKINAEGTRNVAQASKTIDALLIYISTDYIFDGKKKTPYIETDKPNPISVYGRSKLEGENYIREILDRYVIVRSSGLYGKAGKNFVDTILEKAKIQKVLKVVNDQVCSPTYTVDLAKAIRKLVDLVNSEQWTVNSGQWTVNSGQILHITNSASCSWYEFARKILEFAKIKGVEVVSITSAELGQPAKRPEMSILDNTKYFRLTKDKLRSWQEALKNYLTNQRGTLCES